MGKPNGLAASVIIPAYNRGALLTETLASLAQQRHDPGDFEVVVVDDGSTDHTEDMVRRLALPFRLQYLRKPNRNCRAEARNLAVRAARGEVLVFLDAEMLCPPGFIDAHLDLHRRFGPCAVCGWHLRLKRGPGGAVPAQHGDLAEFARAHAHGGCFPGVNTAPFLVPFITANASCLRQDALEIGLFDEAFVGYGHEDVDLGMRLHLLGRRIVSDTATMAYHMEHLESPEMLSEVSRNRRYYYRKHHRRRHVVHIVDVLACGGIERFLVSLSRHLHGRQHLFTVAVAAEPTHFLEDLAELGVEVHHVHRSRLDEFLASRPVDLVHVHCPSDSLPPVLESRVAAPIIATVHCELPISAHPRLKRIVCVGDSVRMRQVGDPSRYRVISPGTDPRGFAPRGLKARVRRELGIPAGAFVVGTAARVDRTKLSERMLRVYLELARIRPDLYAVIMGAGDRLDASRAMVGAEGLSERVLLLGAVRDVSHHLEALDVCLHVVEAEHFGLAVVEALAKGLPVVACKTGGIRETVVDGECGFLCETGEEMIRRVLELADGVHDLARLSRNATARARLFDERRTAMRYKLLYDEVIEGARYGWPALDGLGG